MTLSLDMQNSFVTIGHRKSAGICHDFPWRLRSRIRGWWGCAVKLSARRNGSNRPSVQPICSFKPGEIDPAGTINRSGTWAKAGDSGERHQEDDAIKAWFHSPDSHAGRNIGAHPGHRFFRRGLRRLPYKHRRGSFGSHHRGSARKHP